MDIVIKYRAENGEIHFYAHESWTQSQEEGFMEAMHSFRETCAGKNKILSLRDATLGANRDWNK